VRENRIPKSLAVVIDDPDVPWILQRNHLVVHWVKWNLPPDTTLGLSRDPRDCAVRLKPDATAFHELGHSRSPVIKRMRRCEVA
jgi:phosphatidylethanolamine-binding protein (PEBP) family uncharacterized protein